MRHPIANNLTRLGVLISLVSDPAFPQRMPCEANGELGPEVASSARLEDVAPPICAQRDQFPRDVVVHMRCQDVFNRLGVEGHLRQLLDEYQALKNDHPGDPFYLYLYGRALEGRNTPQAIIVMGEVLGLDPNFQLAHRTLAEIYGSQRFRDPVKEKEHRTKFLAVCPTSPIPTRPEPLPPGGDVKQVERLLKQNRGTTNIPELINRTLEQDAWRQQRMRPFDWYTSEEKKKALQNGQRTQWRAWTLLVQYYQSNGERQQAMQLLDQLRGRLNHISQDRTPDIYWVAATSLTELYIDAHESKKGREVVKAMERFLAKRPDRRRSAELARLRARLRASVTALVQ